MNKKYLSDIEINQNAKFKPIANVAKKVGLKISDLILYGDNKAKIKPLNREEKGRLILVSAINPTPAGEGKTTISIGLNEAMNKIGHSSIVALREPSLGPVFGLKGGATGGGKAQVGPIEDINLHFTGDLHAITSANNLISAMIDNHIYWGNTLEIDNVVWKRCMDMNDRSLRDITYEVKKGITKFDHFQITAASEIMAIFALAKDLNDLKSRVDKIIIAFNKKGEPIYLKDLNISGSVVALLKDAFNVNMVQTLENNPALIHGGPFANIAHGCNSLVATKTALQLADFVVTEAGFGADLGAEKFINIKSRIGSLKPEVVVLVATIRALKMQGKVAKDDLNKINLEALDHGIKVLEKHIENIKNFNLPFVVALNEFALDFEEEKAFIKNWAKKNKIPFSFANVWAEGGKGGEELAHLVVETMKKKKINFTYDIEESIKVKVEKIATSIYGAKKVIFSEEANSMIKLLEKNKLDKQYICMAKTPASLTDNPKEVGIVKDWNLNVNSISISNGAGLIVIHCGEVMTMPGLPKTPQATKIDFDGMKITGLD